MLDKDFDTAYSYVIKRLLIIIKTSRIVLTLLSVISYICGQKDFLPV